MHCTGDKKNDWWAKWGYQALFSRGTTKKAVVAKHFNNNCNIESHILNNGLASNFFKLSQGVRQGCPLSPYLFILAAEILADAIRKKQRIKGIEINSIDFKLSQYADHTTLILDGSEESFLESVIL